MQEPSNVARYWFAGHSEQASNFFSNFLNFQIFSEIFKKFRDEAELART